MKCFELDAGRAVVSGIVQCHRTELTDVSHQQAIFVLIHSTHLRHFLHHIDNANSSTNTNEIPTEIGAIMRTEYATKPDDSMLGGPDARLWRNRDPRSCGSQKRLFIVVLGPCITCHRHLPQRCLRRISQDPINKNLFRPQSAALSLADTGRTRCGCSCRHYGSMGALRSACWAA